MENWQSKLRHNRKKGMKSEKCSDLLRQKVYPYDYMNTFDKFNEEQLPSKDNFLQ